MRTSFRSHFSRRACSTGRCFPKSGEILGVAGLVGAGRTELATTIFGREKPLSGKVLLEGKDVKGLSTRDVIAAGINYVPEDRRQNGVFGMSSVAANTTSSLLFNIAMGKVFLNKKKEQEITQKYIDDFRTKVTGQEQSCGSLSGGNQQKVVIGRCLSSLPKLVILDEPTRGIDAAARGDVYSIILELKKKGVAIMLISSDMEEIIELSDRAVVMFQGHVTRTLSKSEIDQNTLMNASFDVKKKERADMNRVKKMMKAREAGSLLFLVLLILLVGLVNKDFWQPASLLNCLNDSVVFTLLAVGIAFVILTGEIDVSIGATLGMSAAVGATILRDGGSVVTAVLAAVSVGAVIGLVNGFGVSILNIPSLILHWVSMVWYED